MTVNRLAATLVALSLVAAACADTAPFASDAVPATSTQPVAGSQPPTDTPATLAPNPIDSVSPSTSVSATTTVDQTEAATRNCLDSLPMRRRIALLTWPSVYPADWTAATGVVATHRVGGVLLMRVADWNLDELQARLGELDAVGPGILVATDEEGGDVQRLASLAVLPSQQEMSETQLPADAQSMIAAHADLLVAAGIDVVLGPVVDVVPPEGTVPLQRSRFFTGGPEAVAAYAQSYVDGWRSEGLLPVLKHFPGHGSASADTHLDAGVTDSLDRLDTWDLIPYRTLHQSGAAVMVGHLTVPGLTGDRPASLSPEAINYLRDDLGYGDALVISDALGMDAVGLPEPQAAIASLQAGVDVVLYTATQQTGEIIDAVEQAVVSGVLSPSRIDEAAARVLSLLFEQGHDCPSGITP